MICPQCQQPFDLKPWPAVRMKYCSKPCMQRAWYLRNKPRVYAQTKAWCVRNRELRLEVQRRWNEKASAKRAKRRWARENYARMYAQWKQDGTIKLISARTTSRRRLFRHKPIKKCVCRGKHEGRIECHHKDGNPLNTTLTNLEWRCFLHHRRGHGRLRTPKPSLAVRGSSRRRAPTSDRL